MSSNPCRLCRALWAFLLSVALLAIPNLSCAEEAAQRQEQCAPDYDGPRRVTMDHEGRPGVWIAAPVLRCMIADLNELPLVRQRVTLLEEQLSVRGDQIERLRRVLELSRAIEERLEGALTASVESRSEAESRLRAWYRSPAFWYAMGVISAGALVALTAYGLSAVD